MNDDLPQPFGRLTPRPAPEELRARVLDAVAHELARRTWPRLERVFDWAVAASLVMGIGLNVWQQWADEAWQVRLYGPLPVLRTIADVAHAVESVTDAQTGQWVQQRLSDARSAPHHADSLHSESYDLLLQDLSGQPFPHAFLHSILCACVECGRVVSRNSKLRNHGGL